MELVSAVCNLLKTFAIERVTLIFSVVAEHSHRSALAEDIINQAKADLAACLDIPDDYEVIFMQGGGTVRDILTHI